MECETQQIPKQIPSSILHAIEIPVEDYLPYIMKNITILSTLYSMQKFRSISKLICYH